MLQRDDGKCNQVADYQTFEQNIKALQDEHLANLPVTCADGFHQAYHGGFFKNDNQQRGAHIDECDKHHYRNYHPDIHFRKCNPVKELTVVFADVGDAEHRTIFSYTVARHAAHYFGHHVKFGDVVHHHLKTRDLVGGPAVELLYAADVHHCKHLVAILQTRGVNAHNGIFAHSRRVLDEIRHHAAANFKVKHVSHFFGNDNTIAAHCIGRIEGMSFNHIIVKKTYLIQHYLFILH